jgi:hypothetical protein
VAGTAVASSVRVGSLLSAIAVSITGSLFAGDTGHRQAWLVSVEVRFDDFLLPRPERRVPFEERMRERICLDVAASSGPRAQARFEALRCAP